jgi:regulator of nucleoside diphosphate kinase
MGRRLNGFQLNGFFCRHFSFDQWQWRAFVMKFDRHLTQEDIASLGQLAEDLLRLREATFNAGEKLVEVLTTSNLLPRDTGNLDCVSLYLDVAYRLIGSDHVHSIVIVCPHDANEMLGRVSILAPLPMALIGRAKHSIVEVHLPSQEIQYVEIVEVRGASSFVE